MSPRPPSCAVGVPFSGTAHSIRPSDAADTLLVARQAGSRAVEAFPGKLHSCASTPSITLNRPGFANLGRFSSRNATGVRWSPGRPTSRSSRPSCPHSPSCSSPSNRRTAARGTGPRRDRARSPRQEVAGGVAPTPPGTRGSPPREPKGGRSLPADSDPLNPSDLRRTAAGRAPIFSETAQAIHLNAIPDTHGGCDPGVVRSAG